MARYAKGERERSGGEREREVGRVDPWREGDDEHHVNESQSAPPESDDEAPARRTADGRGRGRGRTPPFPVSQKAAS